MRSKKYLRLSVLCLPLVLILQDTDHPQQANVRPNTRPVTPPTTQPNSNVLHPAPQATPIDIEACLYADLLQQRSQKSYQYLLFSFAASKRKTVPTNILEAVALTHGVSLTDYRHAAFDVDARYSRLIKTSNALTQKIDAKRYRALFTSTAKPVQHKQEQPEEKQDKNDNNTSITLDIEQMLANSKVSALVNEANYPELLAFTAQHPYLPYVASNIDLLTAIIVVDQSLTAGTLNDLLQGGLPLTLSALAYMSKHPNAHTLLPMAVQHGVKFPLDTEWRESFYAMNLLSFSVYHQRYDSALFWYQQGVRADHKHDDITALDLLTMPDASQTQAAHALVDALLKDNIGMYLPDTLNKLNRWFTHIDIQRHALSAKLTQRASQLPPALSEEFSTQYQAFKTTSTPAMTPESFQHCKQQNEFTTQKQHVMTSLQLFTPSTRQTVEEKLASLQPLTAMYQATQQSSQANVLLTQMFAPQDHRHKPTHASENDQFSDAMAATRVKQMIAAHKPWNVIKHYADSAQALEPDTITVIVQSMRLDLIEKLMAYGLNVNGTDKQGNNAFVYAMRSAKPLHTFNRLRAMHIIDMNDADLLSAAIREAAYSRKAISIVKQLKTEGVPTNNYHKSLFVYQTQGNSWNFYWLRKYLFEQER